MTPKPKTESKPATKSEAKNQDTVRGVLHLPEDLDEFFRIVIQAANQQRERMRRAAKSNIFSVKGKIAPLPDPLNLALRHLVIGKPEKVKVPMMGAQDHAARFLTDLWESVGIKSNSVCAEFEKRITGKGWSKFVCDIEEIVMRRAKEHDETHAWAEHEARKQNIPYTSEPYVPREYLYSAPDGCANHVSLPEPLCRAFLLKIGLQPEEENLNRELANRKDEARTSEIRDHLRLTGFPGVGVSPAFCAHLADIMRAGKSRGLVMLHGPDGSGRTIAARAIIGLRNPEIKPPRTINCRTLTGAKRRGIPTFPNLASGEICILQNIDALNTLREQETLHTFNSENPGRVILTASGPKSSLILKSENLRAIVPDRSIRNPMGLAIPVPDLHDRRDDIVLIALFFLSVLNKENGASLEFDDRVLWKLRFIDFPTNIRGLRQWVENAHKSAQSDKNGALRKLQKNCGQSVNTIIYPHCNFNDLLRGIPREEDQWPARIAEMEEALQSMYPIACKNVKGHCRPNEGDSSVSIAGSIDPPMFTLVDPPLQHQEMLFSPSRGLQAKHLGHLKEKKAIPPGGSIEPATVGQTLAATDTSVAAVGAIGKQPRQKTACLNRVYGPFFLYWHKTNCPVGVGYTTLKHQEFITALKGSDKYLRGQIPTFEQCRSWINKGIGKASIN